MRVLTRHPRAVPPGVAGRNRGHPPPGRPHFDRSAGASRFAPPRDFAFSRPSRIFSAHLFRSAGRYSGKPCFSRPAGELSRNSLAMTARIAMPSRFILYSLFFQLAVKFFSLGECDRQAGGALAMRDRHDAVLQHQAAPCADNLEGVVSFCGGVHVCLIGRLTRELEFYFLPQEARARP